MTDLKKLQQKKADIFAVSDDLEQIRRCVRVIEARLRHTNTAGRARVLLDKAVRAMTKQMSVERQRINHQIHRAESQKFAEERPAGLDKLIADGLPVLPPLRDDDYQLGE